MTVPEPRNFSDADLADYLGGRGISLDAYSLVGPEGDELPAIWLPEIGFRFVIIEIDDLARACIGFLVRRGARRFSDSTAMFAAAHAERWPGWEQHAPRNPIE